MHPGDAPVPTIATRMSRTSSKLSSPGLRYSIYPRLTRELAELRVRAYLDLLQERDSRDLAADPPPAGEKPDGSPSGPEPDGRSDGPGENGGPGDPGDPGGPGHSPGGPARGPGDPGASTAPGPGPASGPALAALVTLTIPVATWQARSEAPGEAGGFGPLDGDDARDLAAAAARHPRTRWCLTVVNPDGTAAAHGCLPGLHPPPGLAGPAPPGTGPPASPAGLNVRIIPVARGPCDHGRAETGYHPSRTLAHLIRARSATCTAPGCTRPAARCDLDHTRPWDHGGPTCECNLAPLCER